MREHEGFKKRQIEEACSRETHREDNEDFRVWEFQTQARRLSSFVFFIHFLIFYMIFFFVIVIAFYGFPLLCKIRF